MNPQSPDFSIIIPVFNAASHLQDTLNSVYRQSNRNFEIIAINDGSTDDSLKILNKQTDQRLIIIDKKNGGVSSARNTGIKQANGKYIAFLDSDDIWADNHLASAKVFFESHKNIYWYSAQCTICDIKVTSIPTSKESRYKIHNFYISGSFYVNSSSVLIRKSALPDGDLFNENLTFGEDLMAWRSIAKKHPFLGVNHAVCTAYRTRPDSEIHTRKHPTFSTLLRQTTICHCLYKSQHPKDSGIAGYLNDKLFFFYSWHYVIHSVRLCNFLPLIWKYRKQAGIMGTIYISLFIILNNLLVSLFSFPMRYIKRIYYKTLTTLDK